MPAVQSQPGQGLKILAVSVTRRRRNAGGRQSKSNIANAIKPDALNRYLTEPTSRTSQPPGTSKAIPRIEKDAVYTGVNERNNAGKSLHCVIIDRT